MSCEEIVNLYKTAIPKIFSKKAKISYWSDTGANWGQKWIPFQVIPYTQEQLKKEVEERFGLTMTSDVEFNGCYAGAVAREFNEDPERPDLLQIFDSKCEIPQLVSEVLLGSSDAPIYFEYPTQIGLNKYIDGGIAGKKNNYHTVHIKLSTFHISMQASNCNNCLFRKINAYI